MTNLRPAEPQDAPQIRALLAEAFSLGVPDEAEAAALPLDERWVLADAESIQATALAMAGGQWFGGAPVGCTLVRAVAVGSASRGDGVGRRLITGILADQRARGLPLSVLFPSVPAPYRRVGYEYAGDRQLLTAPLSAFRAEVTAAPERISLDDLDEVRACYGRWAAHRPGPVVRGAAWWTDVVLRERTYVYAVREAGELTGYVAYRKQAKAGFDLPYYFDIEVVDAAWTTGAAGLSLLSLLASHAGLGVGLIWPGHAGDLWSRSLRGTAPRVCFAYPWMVRIVDVSRALSDRGYPPGFAGSVSLAVTDETLPENSGAFRLDLADGRGTVTRIERADASLDVGALAPLYSGYVTATTLAAEGRLLGASEADVATLNAAFAGPRPLIAELF